MFEVPYGQDPYSAIGRYIRENITAIEDIIAVIGLNGVETNQLFMVDMKEDGFFVWKSDWYEGEKKVALIDFFPVSDAINPSAQPERRWIPIKTRPIDKEEREYFSETTGYDLDEDEAIMFESPMPDDGEEVWVCSKHGYVWQDTCSIDYGIGLEENGDWQDIVAWMPFERPEPYKEDERHDSN